MDIWHRIGRIVRLSNLGTLIFFLLNFGLLFGAFFTDINNWQSAVAIVVFYLLTVAISLSPVGEFLLAALAGARRIKRRDIKIDVIAFNVHDDDDLAQLRCVADVTSGRFVEADTNAQLVNSMEDLLAPHKQVEALLFGTD